MPVDTNTRFVANHRGPTTPAESLDGLVSADEIATYMQIDAVAISSATSKAVSAVSAAAPDSVNLSIADSKGVSSGTQASTADSKALSGITNAAIADSKALSVSVNTSVASSQAVSVANGTIIAQVNGIPGFLQTTFPTAVLRTANNKMADVISVKDFGVKGDGATDDSAALQAAIDALGSNGGTLLFPLGTYKYATGLVISNQHIVFQGQTSIGNTGAAKGGWSGSVLYYTGTGTGIQVTQVSDHAGWGFTARDMGFRATPAAQRMIFDDNMLWGLLENCWADAGQNQGDDIAPPTSTATFLYSTSSVWTIRHCLISRWNIGVDFAGSVTAGCNSCLIDGGTEILDNNIGVRFGFVVTATGCTLRDAVIQDNVTANIQVYQAVACRIIDCYFEDGAPAPIGGPSTSIDIIGVSAASDVDGFQVHGCYFAGNGYNQSPITVRRGQNISIRDNSQRGYAGTGNTGFINNIGTAVASIYLENNHRVPFDGIAFSEISAMTGVVSDLTPTDLQRFGSFRQFGAGIYRVENTGTPPEPSGATGVGFEVYVAGSSVVLRAITAPNGPLEPILFQGASYTLTSASVPTYANNAAALVGGLTAGMLYMTATGQVMIVF